MRIKYLDIIKTEYLGYVVENRVPVVGRDNRTFTVQYLHCKNLEIPDRIRELIR